MAVAVVAVASTVIAVAVVVTVIVAVSVPVVTIVVIMAIANNVLVMMAPVLCILCPVYGSISPWGGLVYHHFIAVVHIIIGIARR